MFQMSKLKMAGFERLSCCWLLVFPTIQIRSNSARIQRRVAEFSIVGCKTSLATSQPSLCFPSNTQGGHNKNTSTHFSEKKRTSKKIMLPMHLLSSLALAILLAAVPSVSSFVSPQRVSRVLLSVGSTASNDSEISLNPTVASVKVSKTVEIFSLVKQMEADGETVTSLCVGEPDFLPPKAVLDAAIAAVQAGETRYTAVTGTAELRNAIAADLKRRKGLEYNPQTEIIVGNGAKQCVFQGVLATCGPGDAVIVPAPYWPSYPEMVALVGAESVVVETTAESGYLVTPETLRTTLDEHPNTKLIILCNPSNPTGGVYGKDQLEALAAVLRDYPKVAILADEIYERLVYKGDCPSFASMEGMFSRTMTVNGFSKAYAMTGMRLGYIAAPQKLAKAITTIQSQLTSCAGSISQAAGVAALTLVSDEELDKNVEIMREKRDFVLGELEKMKGVSVAMPPNGAFYALPNVSGYFGGDDTELCLQLLKAKKLALVPGSSFGAPGTVRLSYATSMEELGIAMTKLREFLEEQS
jgi:aspartate/glutamate/aspartate-prephenate aminotransferase